MQDEDKRRAAAKAATKATGPSKSARALQLYLRNAQQGYSANLAKNELEKFVSKGRIPAGKEMYRSLTPGELKRINDAIKAGKDYKPNQVRSVGGASDLQKLGKSADAKGGVRFGGANHLANTIAQITAMEDLKGIPNVNRMGDLSELNEEGILGPKTRYKVIDSVPATKTSPGIMRLGAYANSILGPLGFLQTLMQGGEAFTQKKRPSDPRYFG